MRTRIAIAAALIGVASLGHAQADQATLDKIVQEGKMNNQVMVHLQDLTTNIGPRLTASTNLEKAYAWALAKFKEYKLDNVHLEEWGEWPMGFDRGPSTGKMVVPREVNFQFTSPSWSKGTDGPLRGPAVPAPETIAEFDKYSSLYKGAWIVYKTPPPRIPRARPGAEPPQLTPEQVQAQKIEDSLKKAGILGQVFPSRDELTITSGNYNVDPANMPTDVTVTIRKSDMEQVFGQLDTGNKVELEFNLDHKFVPGPRKNYNVVAEIKGTEKPDEVVIFGGHLDSWDGPGSQGAADNGTGTCTVIEAARILKAVGAKPKRTIRFILFTGEEQGLFGSRAYVEQHKAEMDKISCVFIEDGGANYEGGTYALAEMVPMFDQIMATMNKAFPNMPVKMRTVAQMPRGGGSDHVPFNAIGVPGFFWDETGMFDYGYVHHTQHDRIELVPYNYMVQSATNSAVATYSIACAKTLMPRAPKAAPGN
ncbi:MAG: M20/M25/M40 family metallo-hydrolase [Armatimonadetes bacterium]|nr:M20/M25/M40 family metallo-hydrolase [Armatimonadota bacterium]